MITFDRDQAAWGSSKTYPDGTTQFDIDKVVIHWGGYTNPGSGEANEAAVLRAWQRYHLAKKPKPWFDIGYGFAVGNTGLIYRLRGFNRLAATRGDIDNDGIPENAEAMAIVWIGGSGYTPSPAAYASMGSIIRELSPLPVTVHSDHTTTACPGDLWRRWVAAEGWKIIVPDVEGDRMQVGDSGANVKKIQNYLNRWNDSYNLGYTPLAEDGKYGSLTEYITIQFQKWANIESTGDFCWFTAATMAIAIKAKTK